MSPFQSKFKEKADLAAIRQAADKVKSSGKSMGKVELAIDDEKSLVCPNCGHTGGIEDFEMGNSSAEEVGEYEE